MKFLKDGNLLECPENTPKSVYKLMTLCWNSNPNQRPSFRKLLFCFIWVKNSIQIKLNKTLLTIEVTKVEAHCLGMKDQLISFYLVFNFRQM